MAIIVHNRFGDKIDLEDLRPGDINIGEIGEALSKICRFGGRIKEFYSVAQHSVLVASLIYREHRDKKLALCGLLHDAAEAYLGDIVTPLKVRLGSYQGLENQILARILKKYGLDKVYDHELVKKYDLQVYDAEKDFFFDDGENLCGDYPSDPTAAGVEFILAVNKYC